MNALWHSSLLELLRRRHAAGLAEPEVSDLPDLAPRGPPEPLVLHRGPWLTVELPTMAPDQDRGMSSPPEPAQPSPWLAREAVAAAIQAATDGADRSAVFTRNERRAVHQIALFLRQRLGLVDC